MAPPTTAVKGKEQGYDKPHESHVHHALAAQPRHEPHPLHLLREGHALKWLRAEYDRGASCPNAPFWHKTGEKIAAFVGTSAFLGFLDTLSLPKYFPFSQTFQKFLDFVLHGSFSHDFVVNTEYQAFLLASTFMAGVGTLWSFRETRWSRVRNALNLIMYLPALIIMDFVSAEITNYKQTGQFTSILPPADYLWRGADFGNTPIGWLVGAADSPSELFSGWIAAYDWAIYATGAYAAAQLGITLYKHLTRRVINRTLSTIEYKVRGLFGKAGSITEMEAKAIEPRALLRAGEAVIMLGAVGAAAATVLHDGGAALASIIGLSGGGATVKLGIDDIRALRREG